MIDLPPDLTGPAGRAWRVALNPQKWPAALAGFVVEVPHAHPWWDKWFVSMVHLREIEGGQPAALEFPEAGYEFMIVSLDPKHEVDLSRPLAHHLTPPDAVVQFGGVDDRQATLICDGAIRAILDGVMSPDSDYRERWKELIRNTVEHAALDGHPKASA